MTQTFTTTVKSNVRSVGLRVVPIASHLRTHTGKGFANCKQASEELIERVKNSIAVPKYWHSGTEETDDETILEYTSADNPKISVHIEKRSA